MGGGGNIKAQYIKCICFNDIHWTLGLFCGGNCPPLPPRFLCLCVLQVHSIQWNAGMGNTDTLIPILVSVLFPSLHRGVGAGPVGPDLSGPLFGSFCVGHALMKR